MHSVSVPVRRNRHLAGNRGPEADFKRTIRLLAATNAIEEVLLVERGQTLVGDAGAGGELIGVVLSLGYVFHPLAVIPVDGPLVTQQQIVGFTVVSVTEHRVPGEQDVLRLIHGDIHRVRRLHIRAR